MSQAAKLTSPEAICQFMFAGNATLTLESTISGARFTYRVRESDDGRMFFVSLLMGQNNESDYQYIGHFRDGVYTHGRKARVSADAPSAVAFSWFARKLYRNELSDKLNVWHEGRCGACGRKLTVPESIATGLGPECSERLGVPRAVVCEGFDLPNA